MSRAPSRSWLAILLSCLMVFSVITPSFAAPSVELGQDEAISLLKEYRIVQGDDNGNLNLDKPITRAELSKIVVYAMGSGEYAPALAPNVTFDDAKGHWAAGYIEVASRLQLVKGRNATTFDPNAQITNAEVYTILLRMVQREPVGPWSAGTIMQAAASLGIAPDVSLDLVANLPAIRGSVFHSLAKAIVGIPLPDGSTLGKKYLDNTPPVLNVENLATATVEDRITVSGSVIDGVAVTVNGETAPLTAGKFRATVGLDMGANTITIVAHDRIGNEAKDVRTVTRGGEAARIEVSGPADVKAGESVTLSIKPYDTMNRVLPASIVSATVADGKGTFNAGTSTFTAGNKVGPVTITFTSGVATESFTLNILGPASEVTGLRVRQTGLSQGITVGKSGQIEVEVIDKDGNLVPYDDGRTITLQASGLPGVTPSTSSAKTSRGVATFTLMGTQEGQANVVASSQGLTSSSLPVTFTSKTRVVLTADPASAIANGTTAVTIRATLRDENGNLVTNTGDDIHVSLSTPKFDGFVGTPSLVIRRGTSSSVGNDGQLIAGYKTETVLVSGTIKSNHKYSVVPASVSFKEVVIGSATKFEVVGGISGLKPDTPVRVVVRAVDNEGNTIPKGSYAFQVKVSTSNGEELIDGIPEGVNVYLGDTGLNPVADSEGAVVARTSNGTAALTLTYNKSGTVKIEVIGVRATDEAYDDKGELDKALAGTTLRSESRSINFIGEIKGIRLRADLPGSKLTDQEYGVLPANGRATATVKAYLVDANGGWIPTADKTVTLAHTGSATRLSGENKDGKASVRAKNGVAEFTVMANRTTGQDYYEASADTVTSDPLKPLTVAVSSDDVALDQPTVLFMTGDKTETVNRVTLDDTGLLIDLAPYSEGNLYGYVNVFRSGSNTPIFTSDVKKLSDSKLSITVPRKLLQASGRYSVSVNNGYKESLRSDPWPDDPTETVVVEKAASIAITSVRYNAAAKVSGSTVPVPQLIVNARGVARDGVIDPSKLSLYVAKQRVTLEELGADCVTSSGSFTCTLYEEIDPSIYHGNVILDTAHGWYVRDSSGETAGRDETVTDNLIKPSAYVSDASISFSKSSTGKITGTLKLNGVNLTQGKVNLAKIYLGGDTLLGTPYKSSIVSSTSTMVTVKLDDALAQALYDGESKVLSADAGWLYVGTSDYNSSLNNIPVFVSPTVSRVTVSANPAGAKLTITGVDLNGTVNPSNLRFVNKRGEEIAVLNDLLTGLSGVEPTDSTYTIDLGTLSAAQSTALSSTVYLSSITSTQSSSWLTWRGWNGSTLNRLSVFVTK